jgi:ketosteroid isomerase-like protein
VTDADDVVARSEEWQAALEARDVEGIADYLDDDYALQLVHPDRAVVPRAEWLRMLPDYVVHSWAVEERIVDIRGDTALILQRGVQAATVQGADRSGTFVISDSWRRGTDGVWRVWRRHSTPLGAGVMPRADAAG